MSKRLLTLSSLWLAALTACAPTTPVERELTVLYTNDEHGWMEGMGEDNGAANLMQLWRDREGYEPTAEHFILLSGGDNWTGPAISTWNQGESMVELMNTMGYEASAVGNHEFDFGLDAIRQRSAEADYAYLSANTAWRDSGRLPSDLGLAAYKIVETAGLKLAVIGLTTRQTSTSTNPATVGELEFRDYEASLRALMPEVASHSADLTFVISHVCLDELEPLIAQTADLGIDLFGAGHCNELVAKRIGETVLLGGGFHFSSYARAQFRVTADGSWLAEYSTHENSGASAEPEIQAVVQRWLDRSSAALSEVLAYVDGGVARGPLLDQLVVDSWLHADPTADIAITNAGGIRAALPGGEVTLGDTVAILPFDNTIVAVQMSGEEIAAVLAEGARPRIAGLQRVNDEWLLSQTSSPLQAQEQYRVLVNSFMYAGGDGYERLAQSDPEGYDTGTQYGEPFRQWLRSLQSSPEQAIRLDQNP